MTRALTSRTYQVQAATTVEDYSSAASSYTLSGHTNSTRETNTDARYIKNGSASLLISHKDSAADIYVTGPAVSLNMTAFRSIGLWCYVDLDDATFDSAISSLGIEIQISASAFSTLFHWRNQDYRMKPGWNFIVAAQSEFTNVGGASWGTMTAIRVRIHTDAFTGTIPVYLDSWVMNGASTGKIVIMQDDGSASTHSVFYTEMAARSLVGTVYLIPDNIGVGNVTESEAEEIYNAGFTFGMHDTDSYQGKGEQEIRALWDATKREWQARGWYRGIGHLAYPLGYNTTDIWRWAQNWGMKTARATHDRNWYPHHGIENMLRLPYYAGNTTNSTASALKAFIDRAVLSGGHIALGFHAIVASPSISTEFATAEFTSILDTIQRYKSQGLLDVVTIDQWHAGLQGASRRKIDR